MHITTFIIPWIVITPVWPLPVHLDSLPPLEDNLQQRNHATPPTTSRRAATSTQQLPPIHQASSKDRASLRLHRRSDPNQNNAAPNWDPRPNPDADPPPAQWKQWQKNYADVLVAKHGLTRCVSDCFAVCTSISPITQSLFYIPYSRLHRVSVYPRGCTKGTGYCRPSSNR